MLIAIQKIVVSNHYIDELVFKDKQYVGARGVDERKHVNEDSMFKLFNNLRRVKKGSPECLID